MKKILTVIFMFGVINTCLSQTERIRGYSYRVNDWTYTKTSQNLFIQDFLEDSTNAPKMGFSRDIFNPFRKTGKPVPTRHRDMITNTGSDTVIFIGPKTHWEKSRIPVQRVDIERKPMFIEDKVYYSEWIIVGRGKSARRLVWYLAPGAKQ